MRELSAINSGIGYYLDGVAEAICEAPVIQRHVKSLWDRRRCLYAEGPLTDREIRQAKNAVVQMLDADVFKITLLELHRAFYAEDHEPAGSCRSIYVGSQKVNGIHTRQGLQVLASFSRISAKKAWGSQRP